METAIDQRLWHGMGRRLCHIWYEYHAFMRLLSRFTVIVYIRFGVFTLYAMINDDTYNGICTVSICSGGTSIPIFEAIDTRKCHGIPFNMFRLLAAPAYISVINFFFFFEVRYWTCSARPENINVLNLALTCLCLANEKNCEKYWK